MKPATLPSSNNLRNSKAENILYLFKNRIKIKLTMDKEANS